MEATHHLVSSLLAYIGPGGGLGLLGPLIGLLLAIGGALAMLVAWPVRRLLRRSRSGGQPEREPDGEEVEAATVDESPADAPGKEEEEIGIEREPREEKPVLTVE